jgi:bifunctional non-homologous end joining protein LigD
MASQILIGRGLKSRAMRPIEEAESKLDAPPDHPLAFVAIDLLSLDGQSMLDIPLLERKRLLESVLTESNLVRRSAFVRPPVDPWLASWRSMGFRELAYKAANGRYVQGQVNDDWALVRIPTT